jgi:hypothetical protein
VLERTLGTEHPLFLQALTMEGRLLVTVGKHERAVPLLERAIAAMRGKDVPPIIQATARFALAQGLWRTPSSNRERTLELAREAYGQLVAAGDEEDIRNARTWFEKNGLPLPSP